MARESQEATCLKCGRLKVERASHCNLCEQCTLRMDRHSCSLHTVLLGRCIGLNNFRFFFLWLYWLLIGAAFSALLAVYPAMAARDEDWLEKTSISAVMWVSTTVRDRQAAGMAGWVLRRVYLCVLAGQTTIEAARGERKYDVGAKKNWELVFGKSRLWMFGVSTSGLDIPLTVI